MAVFGVHGQAEDRSVDDLLLDGMHRNAKGNRIVTDLLVKEVPAGA